MALGQRIKQARLEAGLSQRQLCGDTITRNMLSQIENGSAQPSMDTLRHLAARLGKPVSFFLEEETASPNQRLMMEARGDLTAAHYEIALARLADFQLPDPILEPEFYLLTALCCIHLAQLEPQQAITLLHRAAEAGAQTPYYTADMERPSSLLLAAAPPSPRSDILSRLSYDDSELLLRAADALDSGDHCRCTALLEAAGDHSCAPWLLLRGDAAVAAGKFALAVQFFTQAEALAPQQVYAKLEQCYLKLDDYKMAYHYACKQR